MSQLEYKNKDILDLTEAYIYKNHEQFDATDINLAFAGYATYGIKNLDILDHLSSMAIKHLKKMPFRNISNLTNYCATLDYKNELLLEHIEKEVVKRLKRTSEFQELLKKSEYDEELPLIAREEIAKMKSSCSKANVIF